MKSTTQARLWLLSKTNPVGIRAAAAIYLEMMSDLDLLDQYTRENKQEAFAALLDRHLKLVYSAALRQVRSPELAEEVTQSVFADLARSAGKLEPQTVLTAWLYQVTRRTAIDVVRRESRRQLREQIAFDMTNMNSNSPEWTAIEPLLDEAMETLDPSDRTAILLRYFEDMSLREVGRTLGTSEDAAQKRVSRALDLLREYFSKRGRAVGVGGLAAVISAHAAQSAPASLKAAILTSAAFSGATVPLVGTIGITKALAMTTLQKALIGATLAATVGAGVFQAHQAVTLRNQVSALQQQQAPLARQIEQLTRNYNDATNRLAFLRNENDRLNLNSRELLKLRGEAPRLRADSQELARLKGDGSKSNEELAERSLLDRVRLLKERLDQEPNEKNPEIQFLNEHDWIMAADRKLDSEDDFRAAFSDLRGRGEGAFLGMAEAALGKYLATNTGEFPTDLAKLIPYFEKPPPDEILQRYQIVPGKSMPQSNPSGTSGDWLITLKSPDSGSQWALGRDGLGATSQEDSQEMAVLAPAFKALFDATPKINGSKRVGIEDLAPYLTTPEQQAAYEKMMQRRKDAKRARNN
jgi:RNA polymerase sigma factor (sigma-70 family)